MTDHALFSGALRERFPAEQSAFDSYEEEVAGWDAMFRRARGMAHYEEQRLRETQQRTARRQLGHLAAATVVRVVDLADGLVELINAERKHAAFAVARALIETASVPAYVFKNVVPHLVKGRGDRVDECLRRLIVGVDPGVELRGLSVVIHPIPVSSLIKALCSEMDARAEPQDGETAGTTMRRLYSSVTDRTHPNHGAVHLSSAIDEHGMDWDRSGRWVPETLYAVHGPSSLAMWVGRNALEDVMTAANRYPLVIDVKTGPYP